MQLEIGSRTDVGRVRKTNEDVCVVVPELNLFIISDGMGGESNGEVASAIVGNTITERCSDSSSPTFVPGQEFPLPDLSERTRRLADAVRLANRRVYEASLQDTQLRGMGATVVTAWLDGSHVSLVHVGDSRAYLFRSGELKQLTEDHSLVAEQVRRGLITLEESRSSSMQNVLMRALGGQKDVELEATECALLKGDTLLLCTDGLSRMVADSEIAMVLAETSDAQTSANRLVVLANEHGGEDNVSAIVVRISQMGKRSHSPFKWVQQLVDRMMKIRQPSKFPR